MVIGNCSQPPWIISFKIITLPRGWHETNYSLKGRNKGFANLPQFEKDHHSYSALQRLFSVSKALWVSLSSLHPTILTFIVLFFKGIYLPRPLPNKHLHKTLCFGIYVSGIHYKTVSPMSPLSSPHWQSQISSLSKRTPGFLPKSKEIQTFLKNVWTQRKLLLTKWLTCWITKQEPFGERSPLLAVTAECVSN